MPICELFSFMQECDIPNWLALIIELVIGGILAGVFFIRQQKQGKKLQKIIDEQEDFRKRRISYANHAIHSYLIALRNKLKQVDETISMFIDSPRDSKERDILSDVVQNEKTEVFYFADRLDEILNQSIDVIDPALLIEARAITKMSQEELHIDKDGNWHIHEYEHKAIIHNISELLKKINLPPL